MARACIKKTWYLTIHLEIGWVTWVQASYLCFRKGYLCFSLIIVSIWAINCQLFTFNRVMLQDSFVFEAISILNASFHIVCLDLTSNYTNSSYLYYSLFSAQLREQWTRSQLFEWDSRWDPDSPTHGWQRDPQIDLIWPANWH